MKRVVISGSGLRRNIISNERLVASYNSYVSQFNTENASRIAAGEIERLEASSVEFIEKAFRYQASECDGKIHGVLDPQRMRPKLERRPDSELSIQAEMAVAAADALVSAGKTEADIDLVICAASIMQRAFPAMAIEVQSALGITQGAAFDMNVACSSATFALDMAANVIRCEVTCGFDRQSGCAQSAWPGKTAIAIYFW